MDILEVIRVRRSVRTYRTQSVPGDLLARVKKYFNDADRLNDIPVRMLIEPAGHVEHGMTGLVGSYGRMVNPPFYAIGITREGENDQVNFGFVMEQFILGCTREGLGTCWVGGFFKKSLLEKAVPLSEDERIVCVSPVGYGEPRRMAERTMRALGGLNTRKPLAERVFKDRWGEPATEHLAKHPALLEIFEAARWAPSASNKQPVHYVIDEKRIVASVLTTLRSKYIGALGKDRSEGLDFLNVDAGIGMAHVHLAARHLGISGKWSLSFDEPGLRKRYQIPGEVRIIGQFEFGR